MARRRLLKRKILTVRVTIPEFDEITQWAIKDGKERATVLREVFDRERERRQQEALDRMAQTNASMRRDAGAAA